MRARRERRACLRVQRPKCTRVGRVADFGSRASPQDLLNASVLTLFHRIRTGADDDRHTDTRLYETRLSRVIDYIHDHLDDELDLNRLAEIACLSPYHWHRIYHAFYGETAAATVRRLRLHRAANELVRGFDADRFHRATRGLQQRPGVFARVSGELPDAARAISQRRRRGAWCPCRSELDNQEVRHASSRHSYPRSVHRRSRRSQGSVHEHRAGVRDGRSHWLATRDLLAPDARWLGIYFDDPDADAEKRFAFASVRRDCAAGRSRVLGAGRRASMSRAASLRC